jgi:hypothetical protein
MMVTGLPSSQTPKRGLRFMKNTVRRYSASNVANTAATGSRGTSS